MSNPPISESWFAEKSSLLVEHLARAMAAHRHIEDEAVRHLIGSHIESALSKAMTIVNAGLDNPPGAPDVSASIRRDPDEALPWLKAVRALDDKEPHRSRPPEGIVANVDRVLEELRIERS